MRLLAAEDMQHVIAALTAEHSVPPSITVRIVLGLATVGVFERVESGWRMHMDPDHVFTPVEHKVWRTMWLRGQELCP